MDSIYGKIVGKGCNFGSKVNSGMIPIISGRKTPYQNSIGRKQYIYSGKDFYKTCHYLWKTVWPYYASEKGVLRYIFIEKYNDFFTFQMI